MKLLSKLGFLLVAVALFSCCGGKSDATPTPTPPTPTPLIITPGPTATMPPTEYRLVYREAGPTEDIIWSVLPTDVGSRAKLATVPHREGYSVRASISPDGTFIAYLSLPELAIGPDSSQAEAYVVDLKVPGDPVKIADFVDYNYTPTWSQDSGVLYMRRYAGTELLNSMQTIIRARTRHGPAPGTRPPTPTPTPEPGIEPWPGPDDTVLKATTANVFRWTPFGFGDDGKSMFFLEESGGTSGKTLIGIYSPVRADDVDRLYAQAEAAWYDAQRANKQAADDAAANGLPPPETTVTPAPTPAPDSRFVVEISQQSVTSASMSPDGHRAAYLDQALTAEGEIINVVHVADLINATVGPLPISAFSPGTFMEPCWFPDGRLTVSLLPVTGGPGQMAIMALDQSTIAIMPQAESGFDQPWGWAPDGSWLASLHWSGGSLLEPGDGRLELISANGHRVTLLEGAANAGRDAVLGWTKAPPPEAGQ